MSTNVEEDVMRIKKRLEKMMKSNEIDVLLTRDMLTNLKKLSIDLNILKTTGIGVVLNNLRKSCNSEELGTLAKSLLKNWKKLVANETSSQQQQVHSPNSNSNDSTSKPVSPSPPASSSQPHLNQQISSSSVSSSNGASDRPVTNGEKNVSMTPSGGVKRSISDSPPVKSENGSSSENRQKIQRSSSASVSSDTKDPVRIKCREMLANALEIPPNEECSSPGGTSYLDSLLDPVELAARCESAIFAEFKNTDVKYKNRLRSRVINLKDSRNPKLRESVRLGYISPEKLATMTPDEMASEEMKKLREKLTKEAINDHQMARTQGAKTSLLKCGKCKRNNVEYTEMQTRSADEPMTTFAFCQDCGHRWKFC